MDDKSQPPQYGQPPYGQQYGQPAYGQPGYQPQQQYGQPPQQYGQPPQQPYQYNPQQPYQAAPVQQYPPQPSYGQPPQQYQQPPQQYQQQPTIMPDPAEEEKRKEHKKSGKAKEIFSKVSILPLISPHHILTLTLTVVP